MADDMEVKRVRDNDKVEVVVNDKQVALEGVRQTGASIKRAAIKQGVPIGQEFLLSMDLGDGRTRRVADDEEIVVQGGERFLAVENDGKVEVTVNDKPIVLEGTRQTGASIKRAAIKQRVPIAQNFALSVEVSGGRMKAVGDNEEIVVHDGQRFLAAEKNSKVEVTVNDKPVVLEGVMQTGASVKQAAIEQGVRIAPDFVLSIELGGGKTELVGDDEEIVVRAGERFLAIENDDNS